MQTISQFPLQYQFVHVNTKLSRALSGLSVGFVRYVCAHYFTLSSARIVVLLCTTVKSKSPRRDAMWRAKRNSMNSSGCVLEKKWENNILHLNINGRTVRSCTRECPTHAHTHTRPRAHTHAYWFRRERVCACVHIQNNIRSREAGFTLQVSAMCVCEWAGMCMCVCENLLMCVVRSFARPSVAFGRHSCPTNASGRAYERTLRLRHSGRLSSFDNHR